MPDQRCQDGAQRITVRIWRNGGVESVDAGSGDACVDVVATDGRCVQLVFTQAGAVMVRGWCGTYKRVEDEVEMDYYSRCEMGDQKISFDDELPPVPDLVRQERDRRLAALRAERAERQAARERARQEAELQDMAARLGYRLEKS